jgi:hypothetical protein
MKAKTVALSLLAIVCGACGAPKAYEPLDGSKRTVFLSAVRTHGPEPVYSRTRWVLPPETLPAREDTSGRASSEGPTLRPVFHLALKGTTLEETARVLAAMARYSSYTAPSIAKNKISVQNLGTIDELARIIERTAKVKVVVDHVNREVRFLAAHAEAPRLYSE